MLPYIGHEFVEALQSLETDTPTADRAEIVCAPGRRWSPERFQSLIHAIVYWLLSLSTSRWMIYIILISL